MSSVLSDVTVPAPQLRTPRIGFLGVGWIGMNRLEAIAATRTCDIVAVADPAREAVERCANVVAGAAVGTDIEELLAADLDGLVIATPSALHAEQSIAALDRGIAVFCQKPLGRSAAEAARVVAAAKSNDVLLGVDLSYRHTQALQRIREVVRAGEIGDVYAVDLVFHNAYGPDKPWFYDRALSGGGCVIDLGIHLVDLALWTLGFPDVVKVDGQLFRRGARLQPGSPEVEDYATATIETRSAVVRLACSWKLPAGRDAVIEASFYGTHGAVSMRNVDGSFYDFIAERFDGTSRFPLSAPPDPWGGRAAAAWASQLASGARFDPSIERIIDVARVLDRIYE